MHALAQSLLTHIRRDGLLHPGERVGVGVSGGIDSVALFRLLMELRGELGVVLSAVHFNHKLRAAEADADQEFVASLAREFGLEFFVESGDVAGYAAEENCGLEAAARDLRYGFFQRLLGRESGSAEPQELKPDFPSVGDDGAADAAPLQRKIREARLDKIATGHTLDDQAETVLMRIVRGTGWRGLGGIHPRLVVENEDEDVSGEIVRPLLGVRRRELEKYLVDLKQPWREDSTNVDSRFTRNRMRKRVVPLLEQEFNPAVVENLAELSAIARDEEDYWDNEVSGWLGTVVQWSPPEWVRGLPGFGEPVSLVQISGLHPKASPEPSLDPELLARLEEGGPAVMNASISRPWLLTEPRAVQRRVLKAVGDQAGIPLEFKHVEEILRFAAEDGPPGKALSLPLGWKMVREPEAMVFVTPDLRRQERVTDYEYPLPVPGRVFIPELGRAMEALLLPPETDLTEYNPQQLLRTEFLPSRLLVRNWRAGDRFWPAQTKAPKKVKELLQQRHVHEPDRRLWPVVANGQEIVWLRGFPVPASLRAIRGEQALLLREEAEEEFGGEFI